MQDILLEINRGPLVENVLRGSLLVVNGRGEVIASKGEPDYVTYMRSAAKPLQASAAVEASVIDHFQISQDSLAVMCGSHTGEPFHVAAVQAVLDKLGLTEETFTLGPALSIDDEIFHQQLRDHVEPRKIYNNCSGKHSCMLAMCSYFGWDIRAYQAPEHPVQQLIRKTVAEYCHLQPEQLILGVDGCGVPVFGMPLYHMALSYLDLCNPESHLEAPRAAAAARITDAMAAHPEMVGGSSVFCTALIRATKGRLIGKVGAEGVYCCGVRGQELAMAMKIEAGIGLAIPVAMMQLLKELDLLTRAEQEELAPFSTRWNYNCQKDRVGQWRPVFTLE